MNILVLVSNTSVIILIYFYKIQKQIFLYVQTVISCTQRAAALRFTGLSGFTQIQQDVTS